MELHLAFLWIYDHHQQLSFHSYVKQSGDHVTCQFISARQYTVRKGQNSWQVKRATQKLVKWERLFSQSAPHHGH